MCKLFLTKRTQQKKKNSEFEPLPDVRIMLTAHRVSVPALLKFIIHEHFNNVSMEYTPNGPVTRY